VRSLGEQYNFSPAELFLHHDHHAADDIGSFLHAWFDTFLAYARNTPDFAEASSFVETTEDRSSRKQGRSLDTFLLHFVHKNTRDEREGKRLYKSIHSLSVHPDHLDKLGTKDSFDDEVGVYPACPP
jgi:hypothetical protein